MISKDVCKKCIDRDRLAFGEDPNNPDAVHVGWEERDERAWRISRLVLCSHSPYMDSISAFDEVPEYCPHTFEHLVALGMGEESNG